MEAGNEVRYGATGTDEQSRGASDGNTFRDILSKSLLSPPTLAVLAATGLAFVRETDFQFSLLPR